LSTLKTFATEFGSFSSLLEEKKTNKSHGISIMMLKLSSTNEVWQLFHHLLIFFCKSMPFYHDVENIFSTTKF
jgi:hypothetical protein